MMRFQDGRLDGSRVKFCSINHSQLDTEVFFLLPSIFPNLKKLTFPYTSYEGLYPADIAVVYGLKDTLEVCGRYVGDCVFTLLPLYEFTQLTQLVLNASCYQQSWKYLKNIPNLTSLALCGFMVDLAFLENLHLHAHKLKQLVMFDTHLVFSVIREPAKIEPTLCLHDFQMFTINDFCDHNSHVLQYIVLKYPNIKSLQLYNKDNIITPRRNEAFLESLKQLINHLDNFKVNFYLMEEHATAITHLVGRGFHTIFPDILNLGRHRRRIRRLCMENITTLSFPIVYIPYIYNKKGHFPHIKHLRLFDPGFPSVDDQCIKLDALLFSYSGLETLDIHCDYTTIAIEATPCIYSSLYHLKLQVLTIQPSTFDFIRNSLPNLTECYLGTKLKSSSFRLELPDHTFHLLTLDLFWSDHHEKRWKIVYKIKTQDGSRKFKYLHRGAYDVKVTENRGIDFGYFRGGCVEIACKRLLQLKHNKCTLL
jgi:hypothetical protein